MDKSSDEIKISTTRLKPFIIGITILILLAIVFYSFSANKIANNTANSSEDINISAVNQSRAYTPLIFTDNNTGCPLNGDVYMNDNFIGSSQNGILYMNQSDYDYWISVNSTRPLDFSINGTTDGCFGRNSNLPFARFWTIDDLQDNIDNSFNTTFEGSLDPRHPGYLVEVSGFVRPYEVTDYFNTEIKKYMKNDTLKDVNQIESLFASFNYRGNDLVFGDAGYWRTPAEILRDGFGGDCKNWAVTVLSLIKVYNPSLNCYIAEWSGDPNGGHMNIFCRFNNTLYLYDQENVESFAAINPGVDDSENKIQIRRMINNYYDEFGLSHENKIYALISDKDVIPFNGNEDFVSWILNKMKDSS